MYGSLVRTIELKLKGDIMANSKRKSDQIKKIRNGFGQLQPVFSVIGDPTRQLILLVLMENSDCKIGMRVGEITSKTHLSRPAVSHQLKIFKDQGIVGVRTEGTKNFYYIAVSKNRDMFGKMRQMLDDIEDLLNIIEEENKTTGDYGRTVKLSRPRSN